MSSYTVAEPILMRARRHGIKVTMAIAIMGMDVRGSTCKKGRSVRNWYCKYSRKSDLR